MVVKNYYKLSEKELEAYIAKIREWVFNYPNDKRQPQAQFALDVALHAQKLKRDEFTNLCIEYLT